ncbi:hypothetical protein [Lysinibacillus sp. FSL W8-0992]|uniref:hypothetical protein n=1 Tax=Lysinibacillus sp. FSL W8-0992 TaxID=2954643 RepID=UPI0030F89B3B
MDDMNDNEAKKAIMDMLQALQGKINEGFDSMNESFDSLDKHFDDMHKQFDSIDKSLDRISQLAEEEIQREKNRKAQYAEMLERLKFPE